jgi:hypothetical protein
MQEWAMNEAQRQQFGSMLSGAYEVVISVSEQHAVVSRCLPREDGALLCRRAANAEELEDAAIMALAREDMPFVIGAQYACPPELAARARWS